MIGYVVLFAFLLWVVSRIASSAPPSAPKLRGMVSAQRGRASGGPHTSTGWGNWDLVDTVPFKANLHLAYRDSLGRRTERTVTVVEIGRSGDSEYLRGQCHLRGDSRTFRLDRIERCVDVATGELLVPKDIVRRARR